MKLSHIILTTLLIGGMILGCLVFINDLEENYGADVNVSGFDDVQEKFNKTVQTSQELKGNVTSMILPETTTETLLVPYKMIKVAWKGLKLVFGSVEIMFSFIGISTNSLTQSLHLPVWTFTLITIVIVIIIIFILIEAFLRWRLQS